MKKILSSLLVLSTIFSLSSCLVYTPEKQEGTIFQSSQVSQIKQGLNKEQVLYVLGSPNQTIMTPETWYYIDRYIDQRGNTTIKKYFVKFTSGKVSDFGFVEANKK